MIKKSFSTFIVLFFVANLFSQTSEDKKYSLISATENVSISFLDILDPYLSPLTYNGLGVGYEHAERKYFNPENSKFSMQGKLNALVGLGFNPAYTAAMTYIGGNYNWGAFYHYRPLKNWQILAGATTDAQLGVKSLSRNVNNPVNVDLAVNLNLAGQARYDFNIFRQPVRLNYELEIPILGCMFVPLAGASYYEMFDLWNLNNAIHFSSLHNKLGLKSALTLDFFLKKSTLQVGFANQNLLYEANNMVFKQNLLAFNIAYKYDFYIFKGRKNQAPANFMSSEK